VARSPKQIENIARGGYVVHEPSKAAKAVIIATGSEVGLALQTADQLAKEGIGVRAI
jgi:transketolase